MRQFAAVLANPYVAAVVIPLLVLMIGACARKLARGPGWSRQDFYLGIEFILASISGALIQLFEFGSPTSLKNPDPRLAATVPGTTIYLLISFFALFFVTSLHQDWQPLQDGSLDRPAARPAREILYLGLLANLIGLALLGGFAFFFKLVS